MGIIDILKGIEKLAVELLLWIIYIPKTIYKIIKDPNWVPGFVHNELSKDDKFKGYMSPVLLFLGISVVLFVLLDTGILTTPNYSQKSGSISDQIQDAVGLIFLTIPLFFALFTEIFRNGGLKREAVMQNIYVQCYYLSPVMLALFAYLIASQIDLASQFDWGNGTYINVSETPMFLFSLTVLWFIIVQVKYISRELRYNTVISLGIILIWLTILSVGYVTYETLFTPVIVNNSEAGDTEMLTMTLPSDDEYRIDIYNYTGGNINDYVISLQIKNSKANTESLGLNLIHNQISIDTVDTQLRYWFNGIKGDNITISLNNLEFKNQVLLDLWTKSPGESLLFDGQGEQTDIWTFEKNEEDNSMYIFLSLPETGKYRMVFNDLKNIGQTYSIGFYKIDFYGGVGNEDFGHISYGSAHKGIPLDDNNKGFNNWKFKGKAGDQIEIVVTPNSKHDVAFDLVGSDGKSVVPIDKTTVANIIHWLYVIFFGYVIFIGFRAFFRSSKNVVVINENKGSKTGRILAIIALVFTGIVILTFIFF